MIWKLKRRRGEKEGKTSTHQTWPPSSITYDPAIQGPGLSRETEQFNDGFTFTAVQLFMGWSRNYPVDWFHCSRATSYHTACFLFFNVSLVCMTVLYQPFLKNNSVPIVSVCYTCVVCTRCVCFALLEMPNIFSYLACTGKQNRCLWSLELHDHEPCRIEDVLLSTTNDQFRH